MMVILLIISLFRGNGKTSIVGVERCTFADYGLLALLYIFAILATLFGVWIFSKDYKAKVDAGYEFTPD